MAKSVLRFVAAAGLIAGGAALCVTGFASAAPPPPPQSGDSRAVVHAGNATTCAEAGLAGGFITVTDTITDNTYITITAVPANTTVTGVVVKGAPAYNVYLPGALGALPWVKLHAPLAGNSGQPATISHWFVCGTEKTTTPPTTTTKTTTTTTTTKSTTTTKPTTTTKSTTTTKTYPTTTTGITTTTGTSTTTTTPTTTVPTTTKAAPTTTTAAVVTAMPTGGALAFTGFSGGWLIVIAVALMLAGLSLLTVPSLLARRR